MRLVLAATSPNDPNDSGHLGLRRRRRLWVSSGLVGSSSRPKHGQITLPVMRSHESGSRYALRIGRLNVNVEPTSTSLLTQILPPCNSTNFRHSVKPSPVPSTFFAAVPTCRNSSNTVP